MAADKPEQVNLPSEDAAVTNEDDGADADGEGGGFEDDAKTKKRKERLEQNRISARESRKRKKTMIEELQRTVITLSRENKDLNERNEQLRSQLLDIGAKYPNVVPIQAIMNGAPPPAPQVAADGTLNPAVYYAASQTVQPGNIPNPATMAPVAGQQPSNV